MKYLDLSGTTSVSFKIGVGENSTELRVINGVLHYRNYGEVYVPLNIGVASYVLSPLVWAPSTAYEKGNLVYYGGVLFQVVTSHTSSGAFLSQNNVYRKVADVQNFSKYNTDVVPSVTLSQLDSDYVHLVGSTTGTFNLKLPDPTSVSLGQTYEVRNDSSRYVYVYSYSNDSVVTLTPGRTARLTLSNASTSLGGWVFVYYDYSEVSFGVERATASFVTGVAVPLHGASGVFNVGHSGEYSFFESSNATLSGTLYYTSGATEVHLVTFSSDVVSGDVPGKFCFFSDNNNVYFKNSTNVTKVVTFHKKF